MAQNYTFTGSLTMTANSGTGYSQSQSGSFRIHHSNAGTGLSSAIETDDNIATAGMIHLLGTVSSGLTAGDGGQLQQNNDVDAHLIIEAEF